MVGVKANLLILFIFLLLSACTETRIKRYTDIVEPHLGSASKSEMNKILGAPTYCKDEGKYERCEYRTSRGRNESVPAIHRKEPAMGPDLTPYEHFDVLHLYYDGFAVLKEWEPIVVQ